MHVGSELQELSVALNTQSPSLMLYTSSCDKNMCDVPHPWEFDRSESCQTMWASTEGTAMNETMLIANKDNKLASV